MGSDTSNGREWHLDISSTVLEFQVRHMVVSTVTGRFSKFSGIFRGSPDNITESSADVVIDSSTFDTHDRMRDKKLKSAKFLDVEKYPHIRFQSSSIERRDGGGYSIIGDLRIKGVTNKVSFTCEITREGNPSFDFVLSGSISSEDFGLKWKSFFDPGEVFVGSTIHLKAEGTFVSDVSGL